MNMDDSSRKIHLEEEREYHSPSSGLFFEVKKRLFSGVSSFQKIEIFENEAFGNVLFLDGLVQTTEKDEHFYHEMIVHPAFMSHPQPKTCLIIGGGDGGTLREVLRHAEVDSVSLVEIDRLVIEVCQKYFPWLDNALKDERAKIVIADGNAFLDDKESKYDIVIIDSSEPLGPSSVLHGREFYQKLKLCLNSDGIVVAQTGSPFFHLEFLKKTAGMLKTLFPIVRFYLGTVPTYPGGIWSYVFLSENRQPLEVREKALPGLKYYTRHIHRAAFALPGFLEDPLGQ